MSGDAFDLPAHLRPDAPVAICGRCGRQTVAVETFGTEDRMPQPDGYPCGGRFSDPTKPQQRPAPCTMLGHVWMVVVNGAGHPQVVVCEVCGRTHLVGVADDHELCDRQLRPVSLTEWDEPTESEAGTLAALAAHAEAVATRG